MFGELVCGPPGSGKTTYCEGKRQFLSVYDPTRPVTLVNLDPANDGVFPYPCDVDICELVKHSSVMEEEHMGPNGTYLLCAKVMEENVDWIIQNIEEAVERRLMEVASSRAPNDPPMRAPYLVVDCPGQVEFYINSTAVHAICHRLQKQLRCTMATVHLVDATIATRDISTYVSACLLSITTLIDHELPHVNVMTKWDTMDPGEAEDSEVFLSASSFLAEDFDRMWKKRLRRRLLEHQQAAHHAPGDTPARVDTIDRAAVDDVMQIDLKKDGGRLYRHSRALMDVVDGYGMVGFMPLNIQSQDMMLAVTREIDNALGNFC